MPGNENVSLASMGIYIFEADYLYQLLEEDIHNQESKHDFRHGRDPAHRGGGKAFAHPFNMSCVGAKRGQKPYWRDVGTPGPRSGRRTWISRPVVPGARHLR